MNKIFNKYFFLISGAGGFILRTLYGLAINFRTESAVMQDYTQIYLIGLKFYTSGIWPFWGPDIIYSKTQIPGALQGLLVGTPFYIWESAEAPVILLGLISTSALVFFGWYIHKRIPGVPKWFIVFWLLLSPWTINFSTTTLNPSYVLAPAIFFFTGIFEVLPFYKKKLFPVSLSFFFMGFAIAWIMQLHMSWVLLPFYVIAAGIYLIYKREIKNFIKAVLFFILGFIIPALALIPAFLKYNMSSGGVESNIVFNEGNLFKLFDFLLRFLSFSAFDVQYFIQGKFNVELQFLSDHLWAAVFIIPLFITGLAQVGFYIVCFFLKNNKKEFKFVKIFTILTILLLYSSYLFAIRSPANWTFYLLLPVCFWYSFYCMEKIFKFKTVKKAAYLFAAFAILFHITIATTYFDTDSLYSRKDKIQKALKEKDSRYFGFRRVAAWEMRERQKEWTLKKKEPGDDRSYIHISNDFEYSDKSVIPESVYEYKNDKGNHFLRVDKIKPKSDEFLRHLSELEGYHNLTFNYKYRLKKASKTSLNILVFRNEDTMFKHVHQFPSGTPVNNEWNTYTYNTSIPDYIDENAILNIYFTIDDVDQILYIDDVEIDCTGN